MPPSRCPRQRAPRAWESFPEVNRVVVQRLLGLLVERMATAAPAEEPGRGCGR